MSYLCHGCQKWHLFSARVRLNDSAPGEHNGGPFRSTPSHPFPAERTAARRTELTNSPRYGEGYETNTGLLMHEHPFMMIPDLIAQHLKAVSFSATPIALVFRIYPGNTTLHVDLLPFRIDDVRTMKGRLQEQT